MNGNTALAYAVKVGHEDIVKELINAGADVNAKNNQGEIPLRGAISKGFPGAISSFPEIATLLINTGTDIIE